MYSFTQKLFELFGFQVLLWHAIVAVAALLVVVVIIIAAAVSKRKKAKKLAELQRQPLPESQTTATATQEETPEQTEAVEDKEPEKEQKSMPKQADPTPEAKKANPQPVAKKTETPKAQPKKAETKPEPAAKPAPKAKAEPKVKAITAPKADRRVGQLPDDVETVDTEEQEKLIEQKQRNGARYYHVSLRDDDKWQVKLSKGGKAIKLFNKQSEAINYARELARSNHGHIVIHRVNGKIRKTRY